VVEWTFTEYLIILFKLYLNKIDLYK
jgi:hypothetical protein